MGCRVVRVAMLSVLLATTLTRAQTPAEWAVRILDPAEVGLKTFPGAELHTKLTTDTIRHDRDGDLIAVFIATRADLEGASSHFRKELGVEPRVTGADTEREIHWFEAKPDRLPARIEWLTVQVGPSPWITDKLQITIEARPRKAAGPSGTP